MKAWLHPHPDTNSCPVLSIGADVSRKGSDRLAVKMIVAGTMGDLLWPGNAQSGFEGWDRADKLWEHTCFEIFATAEGLPGYLELNFATSANWAAYEFNEYREGMRSADFIGLETGRWKIREQRASFEAVIRIPPEFAELDWRIGLSAIIEEKSGTKSYWALRHPPGKPDFHHPDCFALTLEAPD